MTKVTTDFGPLMPLLSHVWFKIKQYANDYADIIRLKWKTIIKQATSSKRPLAGDSRVGIILGLWETAHLPLP